MINYLMGCSIFSFLAVTALSAMVFYGLVTSAVTP